MLKSNSNNHPQHGFFDLLSQLDEKDPLILLGKQFNWIFLEEKFAVFYSDKGAPAKPIRLMCGLLMLKQLYNLSDEAVVQQWKMNPYFQVFCGETEFQTDVPCHPTELVKFRQRIGEEGVTQIFTASVELHGKKRRKSRTS